jgi:hypothetical protein
MAIFTLDLRTASGATTNSPCWSIQTTANHVVKIIELKIVTGSATASEYSLGKAAASGTQSGSSTALSSLDLTTTSSSTISTTWSVNPTVPAKYVEGWNAPATVGSMVYWSWPDGGLLVPASSELVLWNTGAGTNAAIQHFSVKFEEL